jgi:hypothetical protein
MISSRMIRFHSPEEGFIHPRRFHGQVSSGSLPAPVSLQKEEQRLEREQNEHDLLEALGDYWQV